MRRLFTSCGEKKNMENAKCNKNRVVNTIAVSFIGAIYNVEYVKTRTELVGASIVGTCKERSSPRLTLSAKHRNIPKWFVWQMILSTVLILLE